MTAQTLDLDQAALATEARHADGGELAIYIGGSGAAAQIRQVSVQLDEAMPVRYDYSEAEATALDQSALHALFRTEVAAGPHRLRALVIAHRSEGGGPDLQVSQDFSFTKTTAAQALEVDLLKSGLFGTAKLALRDPYAQPADGKAALAEPHQRAAAFLAADGRAFAAASELLREQASASALPADYYWQLGDALANLGLAERAQAIYQQAGVTAPVAPPDGEDARAAQYSQALALLKDEAQAPAGLAQLQQLGGANGSGEEFLILRDRANLTLGYWYLHHRQGAAAIPLFDRVRSPGPYGNRAMLGLGWALLAPPGQAAAGTPAAGDSQPRVDVILHPRLTPDIEKARLGGTFPLRAALPREQQALKAALVPWVELTGRDPLDPAVQEGMLAIAYALNHVGAYQQAQERYLAAIALLEQADAWLTQALRDIDSGGLIAALDRRDADTGRGWHWWLADTDLKDSQWWLADHPQPPPTFYFRKLFADDAFLDAVDDYRALRALDETLDEHAQRLSGYSGDAQAAELQARIVALRPSLAAAMQSQRQTLSAAAATVVKRYLHQTRTYLAEAYFSMARIHDQPPPAAGAGS